LGWGRTFGVVYPGANARGAKRERTSGSESVGTAGLDALVTQYITTCRDGMSELRPRKKWNEVIRSKLNYFERFNLIKWSEHMPI
jgi:hypothetical protein